MEDAFCPECGRLKEDRTLPFCQDCHEDYLLDYERVRDLVRENVSLSLMELADLTGLSIRRLRQMVQFGGLRINR